MNSRQLWRKPFLDRFSGKTAMSALRKFANMLRLKPLPHPSTAPVSYISHMRRCACSEGFSAAGNRSNSAITSERNPWDGLRFGEIHR
jgi:hypothetical protein